MRNSEETEMPGNCILTFLRNFPCIKLYCILTSCSVLHMSVTQQIKLDCASAVVQCNRTRDGITGSVRVMHLPLNVARRISNFYTSISDRI